MRPICHDPEPTLASLRRLIESPSRDVIAVLTRPDAAAAGRGKPQQSPVAREAAAERGVPRCVHRDQALKQGIRRQAVAGSGARVLRRGCLRSCSAVPLLAAAALAGSACTSRCCRPGGAAPVRACIAAGDTITRPRRSRLS